MLISEHGRVLLVQDNFKLRARMMLEVIVAAPTDQTIDGRYFIGDADKSSASRCARNLDNLFDFLV